MSVTAKLDSRTIPTYPVGAPEKNPVFFEKRVYQGSNGKVYPVPFIDKVHDEPVDVTYQRALLENEFVRLEMLPEIGGRIFTGQDKTNKDYDFFYRQDVIKPALVGLAGPWISGGVEFNWPQHHRPGTFLPTDVHIEQESDGACTVWMSEHDPIHRMKGMHGIRLRPDSSLIELRARLYNRTPFVRTFLWWANVAAEVHDQYQSFFPQDVHYVADHAVRATSSFPAANNPYYGIDYQNRPGANDLGWYKNIPVPTSYMVCQTNFNFFGGYDFSKQGGFVHLANRYIAPGKKQWTWGDDKFGHAWDRELTDKGGPYVELMAGVYTDNQPDFTYLLPYETKTFSQFWWPIQNIGPVQQANNDAALACVIREDSKIALGLCVSSAFSGKLVLTTGAGEIATFEISLGVGESWQNAETVFAGENPSELLAELRDRSGKLVLDYRPVETEKLTRDRDQATEPAPPEDIASADELYFTGEHLEQYRHPTRNPELYWNEVLKRDPGDARCHTALGRRALDRGKFEMAREHFEAAVARLTSRHPNPVTGEAHYHLGLTLRWLGDKDGAYEALYKSTWNYEWRSSAYYQLATIDCTRKDWEAALQHLEASLDTNRQNNKAQVLQAIVLQKIADGEDENSDVARASRGLAAQILVSLLAVDPLDHWASITQTGSLPASSRNDAQTVLDIVFDYCEAEIFEEAIALLETHHAHQTTVVAVPNPLERTPMTHYALAWLKQLTTAPDAESALQAAIDQPADHFFPSRLEEMVILQDVAGVSCVAGASCPDADVTGSGSGFQPLSRGGAAEGQDAPATVGLALGQDARATVGSAKGQDAPATVFVPSYFDPAEKVEIRTYSLPHWEQEKATYAVTFRLGDSLPQSVLMEYVEERNRLTALRAQFIDEDATSDVERVEDELAQCFRDHIESALDRGIGECYMKNPEIARVVASAITHFDGDRYDLAAWCVMPNHVHLIIRPRIGHSLERVVAGMKSFSAQQANKILGRSGAFWMSESYDHIIRDERDFFAQLDYLKRNPEKARLTDWQWIFVAPVVGASCVAGASCPDADVTGSGSGFQPLSRSGLALGQDAPATVGSAEGQDAPATDYAPATFQDSATCRNATAAYALGNLWFDRRRHADAIVAWEAAAAAGSAIPQVYRNLAIAVWNHSSDGERAASLYARANELDPSDARLVSESDQLAAKRGIGVVERLAFLEAHRDLTLQRDDATVAMAELYNQSGQPRKALDLILSRRFHPWEGGEGAVLKQFTTAHLLLGQAALDEGDPTTAHQHFTSAMDTPESLGEAYHPLQAKADVNYWIGRSLAAMGDVENAREHFVASANEAGDFAGMAVTAHSPLSYYRGLSFIELGRMDDARELFQSLKEFAEDERKRAFQIDYFATSLPNLLVFDEDMQARHEQEADELIGLADEGLARIL